MAEHFSLGKQSLLGHDFAVVNLYLFALVKASATSISSKLPRCILESEDGEVAILGSQDGGFAIFTLDVAILTWVKMVSPLGITILTLAKMVDAERMQSDSVWRWRHEVDATAT